MAHSVESLPAVHQGLGSTPALLKIKLNQNVKQRYIGKEKKEGRTIKNNGDKYYNQRTL